MKVYYTIGAFGHIGIYIEDIEFSIPLFWFAVLLGKAGIEPYWYTMKDIDVERFTEINIVYPVPEMVRIIQQAIMEKESKDE